MITRHPNPHTQGPRKAFLHTVLSVVLLFPLLHTLAYALDVPALKGRVNDYAGVIRPQQAQSLEAQLARLEADTGHQVAVLTVPTLEGEDIEGFSIRVAENWKIGKKGFDNGVILVVAVKDRKLRLEVGYGLEGVLPDLIAKRITSDYIVPRFRADDYGGGIVAGIDAVQKVIRNEPLPESARRPASNQKSNVNFFLMLVIIFAVMAFMSYASSSTRRRNNVWGTRGRRGGPPIIFGPPFGGGGGGFSGGGFGGGGFGGGEGGGFSGGGGGFGGGGASDSW
jgi:uncharacterized protein